MMSSLKLPLKIAHDEGCGAVEIHDRDDDCRIVIWIEDPYQPEFYKHLAEVIVAALEADAEEENTDG